MPGIELIFSENTSRVLYAKDQGNIFHCIIPSGSVPNWLALRFAPNARDDSNSRDPASALFAILQILGSCSDTRCSGRHFLANRGTTKRTRLKPLRIMRPKLRRVGLLFSLYFLLPFTKWSTKVLRVNSRDSLGGRSDPEEKFPTVSRRAVDFKIPRRGQSVSTKTSRKKVAIGTRCSSAERKTSIRRSDAS